jgi:hypothetical protein
MLFRTPVPEFVVKIVNLGYFSDSDKMDWKTSLSIEIFIPPSKVKVTTPSKLKINPERFISSKVNSESVNFEKSKVFVMIVYFLQR